MFFALDDPAQHPGAERSAPLDELGRILIVDDDETNRLAVRVLMERRNYSVREAASGEEALGMINDEPIDLVLMDLRMPGMDGFETTRRIRKENTDPALPVVALTVHTSLQQQAMCMDAGMNAVLGKPFDPQQLDRLMTLLDLDRPE